MKLVVDSIEYIASARDVGNFAAGFITGKKNLSWRMGRAAFDSLETISQNIHGNRGYFAEGQPSQLAQRFGYDISETNAINISISYFYPGMFAPPVNMYSLIWK